MKVTIHQPEHFPYLGYFQKMHSADILILLDNVNYRKNYFQNRNRFMNHQGREEWFTIPVPKNSVKKHIKDVEPAEIGNWRRKILTQHEQRFGLDLSTVYEPDKLFDINFRSITYCAARLGVTTPVIRASDMKAKGAKSELLANLCREVGSTHYISGPSGKDYLDMKYFDGIEVTFFEPNVPDIYTTLSHI